MLCSLYCCWSGIHSVWTPSDGVFGRFGLAALCGCHTFNVCYVMFVYYASMGWVPSAPGRRRTDGFAEIRFTHKDRCSSVTTMIARTAENEKPRMTLTRLLV